jgi:hypothetical protein
VVDTGRVDYGLIKKMGIDHRNEIEEGGIEESNRKSMTIIRGLDEGQDRNFGLSGM